MGVQNLNSNNNNGLTALRNDIVTSKDGSVFRVIIKSDQPLTNEEKNNLFNQANDFAKNHMSENIPQNQPIKISNNLATKSIINVSGQPDQNNSSPGFFKGLINRIVKFFKWLFGISSKKSNGNKQNVVIKPVVNDLESKLKVQNVNLIPHSSKNTLVSMDIAQFPKGTKLTEKNLDEIFGVINKYTGSKPYAVDKSHKDKINGNTVYRPNHSGPHAARKVRFLETMFDLIDKKGSASVQKELNALTADEKLVLKLATYCLRVGRTDENDGSVDDYKTRSAQIFKAYADQLGIDNDLVEWGRKLIIDNCKQGKHCISDNTPKNVVCRKILNLIHNLDLVRCFPKDNLNPKGNSFAKERKYMVYDLDYLLDKTTVNTDAIMDQLTEYSIKLSKATGDMVRYSNIKPKRDSRFVKNSEDAVACFNVVRSEPLPVWN